MNRWFPILGDTCKMFIRGKPIRFGFKNWVLAADDGYPFQVVPYQGKEQGAVSGLLGPRVVNPLLEVVKHPAKHEVYFDNFFTSIPLLLDLRKHGMKATGTVRNNRTGNCPLTPAGVKLMQKKERGEMEVYSHKERYAVRWVDNRVVTLISNTYTIAMCKRYSRAEKAKVDVPQPDCIKRYNLHMEGVDLLDSYLNNLRPSIGGKKWYWTQLVNFLRQLQVAAYRLYSRLHPEEKIVQLNFLRNVVHQYKQLQRNSTPVQPDEARLVPMLVNNHILAPFIQGRCKVCRKNTKKGCLACNVRLHEKCFPAHHI